MYNPKESMVQVKSCLPQTPSISFDEGSAEKPRKSLLINPNLPQSNEFTAYGYIPVKSIPKENFKKIYWDGKNPVQSSPFLEELNKIAFSASFEDVADEKASISTLLKRTFSAFLRIDEVSYVLPKTETTTVFTSGSPYDIKKTTDTIAYKSIEMLANEKLEDVVAKLLQFEVNPDNTKRRAWSLSININTFNKAIVTYEKQSKVAVDKIPQLMIVEEYKVASFLGQYGLGRVLRTFSLLPGEKTTLRMKTYKEITSIKTQSENILDSQSKESVEEMERLAQEEKGSTSSNTNTKSANLDLSFKIPFIGGGGGASASVSNTSVRTTNAQALSKALDKHVNKSNANRQVQINTSTTETSKDTEETSTEREVVNYNKSRVLNFVFRQLQQEYINITYLNNIKIAFHTGTPDSLRIVPLEELSDFLDEVLDLSSYSNRRIFAEKELLKHYCRVTNYDNKNVQFLEQTKTEHDLYFPENIKLMEGKPYWRKSKSTEVYNDGNVSAPIDGIILNVQKTTLKTSSVLAEAILGQVDALDCFNLQIQDSESQKGYMDLFEREQRLKIEESRAANEHDKVAAEVEKMNAEKAKLLAEATLISDVIDSADVVSKVEVVKELYSKCCTSSTKPLLIP
jgi:hypothetical protein